ncbi:copper-sensing transcriptional repressor CsoR [soil metagenome]|jgi:DNA-binding FrmR family transcriptional regulator|nr:metal-sensitive transcriptional regulator [Gemmatimonadota bacterium]
MESACPSDSVYLEEAAERRIRNRLRRLKGQVSGIERMLEEHKSCDDILVQIAALKQAVNGVAVELLQAHMETCVMACVEAGEGKEALESLKGALSRVLKHA